MGDPAHVHPSETGDVNPVAEMLRTMRYLSLDGHRVLVSKTMCSVMGEIPTWAWVWRDTETDAPYQIEIDWDDHAAIEQIGWMTLQAFHAASRTAGRPCPTCGGYGAT